MNIFEVGGDASSWMTRGDRDHLKRYIGPKLTELKRSKFKWIHSSASGSDNSNDVVCFHVDTFYPGPAGSDLKEIYRRIWESSKRDRKSVV